VAVIVEEWNRHGVRVGTNLAEASRGSSPTHSSAAHISPFGQLLILGHYDTVYSTGTLAKMPFGWKAEKPSAPGTFDMKAGIVQALFALQALPAGGNTSSQNASSLSGLLTRRSAANPRANSSKRRRRRSDAVFRRRAFFGRAAC